MADAYYAQTAIEVPGSGPQKVYQPGDRVTKELPGFEELIDGGAVGTSPPEKHVQTGDGAQVGESA